MISPRVKTSGVVKPHEPRWGQRAGASVICGLERLLSLSLRDQLKDEGGYAGNILVEPSIFCIWHNRLALSMFAYRKYVRRLQPTRRMAALVSASRDGAFLAAILEGFGIAPVRGSSSRRGSQALLELTRWAERGYDLAITPDGPRGPRYAVQDGILALAQLTGLSIVPVTLNLSRKFQAKSWDRFQVPSPFARCEIIVGRAISVPRGASDTEREVLRMELQNRMLQVTRD